LDRLHDDCVVPAHEGERRLVVEVAALAADALVLLGAQLHRLLAAMAPLLAPGYSPLHLLQRALGLPVVAQVRDDLPVRRGEEHRESHVETGTSAQEQQTSHPSASRETVTVLMLPSTGRDQRTAMRPIFDRTR
jgi:hypothetical protein